MEPPTQGDFNKMTTLLEKYAARTDDEFQNRVTVAIWARAVTRLLNIDKETDFNEYKKIARMSNDVLRYDNIGMQFIINGMVSKGLDNSKNDQEIIDGITLYFDDLAKMWDPDINQPCIS